MARKLPFIGLLIFWLPGSSFADIDRDDPSAYGIGILTCPYANFMLRSECFRALSWLQEPVSLYEEPENGSSIVGTILDPDEDLQGWQPFNFRDASGAETELEIVEIGYEDKAIVIYEQNESWLQTGKGWIKKEDVRLDASTVLLPWSTVLAYQMRGILEGGQPYIGWFFPIADQPLFDSPNGEEIGVFWEMASDRNPPELLVLNRQDNWIEVTIDTLGTTCSIRDRVPDGPTGWVQLMNEAENPLVYWYTRGC